MSNSVNSTPGNPRIIQINTPGPQGPQGPAGSITTGSLSGDFNALNITASGNISASGNIMATSAIFNGDTQITGSLIVSGASNSVFDIDFFDLIITGGLDVSRDVVVRDDLTVYDDANLRGTECNIGYGDDAPGFGYTLFVTQSSTNASGAAFIDGDITVASGVISSSLVSTNYSLTAYSASFFYISASHLDLDSSSLSIGGEPWTQADVVSLKAGKSLRQDQKQIVNENDTSTFVRMSSAGRAWHYASNKPLIKLQTSSFDLGSTDIPMTIEGSSLVVTGSTEISGSCVVSGSFTVTDLLTLLGNYGQTGSFAVSGSSEFTGDTNFDGVVNSQDLLNVLAGFGNTSGSNVDCSGSIDETYDNDIQIISSSIYSDFANSGSFAQIKVRSGSTFIHPGNPYWVPLQYTGSGTIDFELPPISSVGPGFSYHIINRHNFLYQSEVTMSISPNSADKFLYLPSGITGSDNKSLLSYTPSGSTGIGNGNPFIKFTYGNSDGWSITELGGTWEQEA
tara:strand:+ start:1356 stop:2885 length:1530 start_codon:yes stop_codon:yes gene_type:complete